MTNAQTIAHNQGVNGCTCNECLPFEVIESTLDQHYWSKEWESLDVVIHVEANKNTALID